MLKNFIFTALVLSPLPLPSFEFMKDYFDYHSEQPLPNVANDFVYGDGNIELTTQINAYENITANTPIQGSAFITHPAKDTIDVTSFKVGNKPLKIKFVQSTTLSPYSDIAVTIYSFELPGLPIGTHTLPSIHVKVAGKEVQALPLVIEVSR